MIRRATVALIAVVLAAVGTFLLTAYVRGAEDRALAGEATVDVLVVKEEIPRGTDAGQISGFVSTEKVPAKVQAVGSVASLDDLKGRVASVDLVPGEQIVSQRFVNPATLAAQGAVRAPEGAHQVTLLLDPQRALGGMVKPGDKVGVLGSFLDLPAGEKTATDAERPVTHLMLHKILVTNVQGAPAPAGAEADGDVAGGTPVPAGQVFVTLAVSATAAERVVFAAEHGTVWLTSEPDEAPEGRTKVQTKQTVFE